MKRMSCLRGLSKYSEMKWTFNGGEKKAFAATKKIKDKKVKKDKALGLKIREYATKSSAMKGILESSKGNLC